MFEQLQRINAKPAVFSHYTAEDLWTDDHTSARMLAYHLDGSVDVSSRRTAFIDRSARWITARFRLGKGKRVADFGCGPGLYTTRLARSGADVTGIDFSERSIRHARGLAERSGLSIDYVRANYLGYEPSGRFDLITLIMCDFCALGPAQRRALLDTFYAALVPGGSVLLDVYSLNAFEKREEAATYAPGLLNGFWSPHPYFGFLNTFRYEAEKVVLDKYTIVEATRTRVVYNWLQYFDPKALEQELAARGFVLTDRLGDVAGGPFDPASDELAVVATRPTEQIPSQP